MHKAIKSSHAILFLAALICSGSAFAQTVQERYDKSLANAKVLCLTNIEICWRDTLSTPGLSITDEPTNRATAFYRTFEYTYIASGVKHRNKCQLISGSNTNLQGMCEAAYDGDTYSTYLADSKYMTTSHEDAKGGNDQSYFNPLIAPFMFLTKYSDACKTCILQFNDYASKDVSDQTILPAPSVVGGVAQIILPGLTNGMKPTVWTIYLDAGGDEFRPSMITYASPGLKMQITGKFLNYTNLGPYWFPATIDYSVYTYPSPAKTMPVITGAVALVSARTPSSIDDSVFRLDDDRKKALVVWDWNANKMTKSTPDVDRIKALHGATRVAVLSLLIFTALVVPIGMLAVKRFAKKQ